MRPLTGVESELPLQRPGQDANAIAGLKAITSRELDQPVMLARPNLVDYAVRDDCRRCSIEDELGHVRAPPRRPPPRNDDNKQVAREQARLGLNPPAMPVADNPQPRTIGLEPVQPQEMLRRALLMRLDLCARPIGHRSPRPELAAMELTNTWAILAKGRRVNQLARPVVPRALAPHVIRRGIEEKLLQVPKRPKSRTWTQLALRDSRQRRACGHFKSGALRPFKRRRKLDQQTIDFMGKRRRRRCHGRRSVRT